MQKEKCSILLVEDDDNLGIVVRDYLVLNNFEVSLEANGIAGWEAYSKKKYDLCILDVMMPEMDGFNLAEKIRKQDVLIPIIFLTAKSSKDDVVKGFNIGADDYILKPFNIEELVLRIKVFLKRLGNQTSNASLFNIGKYIFNFTNLSLVFVDKTYSLTQREAEILKEFCLHKGEILKREYILLKHWGNDDFFSGRSLDVFISRLRKYLINDTEIEIQNIHSVGFRLNINHNKS